MPGPADFVETYVTEQTLDASVEEWLGEIRPYCWRETEPVDAGSIALLVVDMTRPFVDPGRPLASPNARAVLPRVQALVDAFRRVDRPVLWIVQGHHSVGYDRGERLSAWWPTPILEGTEDVGMADGLAVADGEKVIVKRRYSAFYQTDLECTLRCLGIAQVVIAGVLTNVCPFAPAVDAFSRDLCVYYPADATAAHNRELHVSALRSMAGWFGYVVRAQEIIAALP
jgi:ureidoacrylate peracid hydrolase